MIRPSRIVTLYNNGTIVDDPAEIRHGRKTTDGPQPVTLIHFQAHTPDVLNGYVNGTATLELAVNRTYYAWGANRVTIGVRPGPPDTDHLTHPSAGTIEFTQTGNIYPHQYAKIDITGPLRALRNRMWTTQWWDTITDGVTVQIGPDDDTGDKLRHVVFHGTAPDWRGKIHTAQWPGLRGTCKITPRPALTTPEDPRALPV